MAFFLNIADLHQIGVGQDRIIDLQHMAVFRFFFQQVTLFTGKYAGCSNNLLTDRIDRRVGYLGKQLLEVVKQRLMSLIQHRQRCVDTHGSDTLGSVGRHIQDRCTVFLIGVAKSLHQALAFFISIGRHALVRNL